MTAGATHINCVSESGCRGRSRSAPSSRNPLVRAGGKTGALNHVPCRFVRGGLALGVVYPSRPPRRCAAGAFPRPFFAGCRSAVHIETRTARAGGDGHHRCTLPSAACDARTNRFSGAIPRGTKRQATQPRSAFGLSVGETRQGRQARECCATIRRQAHMLATLVHQGLGPRPVINAGPLSERCCWSTLRPSRVDGGCHPKGRTANSIAPSAECSKARVCHLEGDDRSQRVRPALGLFSGSRPEPDLGSSGDRRGETRTLPLSARHAGGCQKRPHPGQRVAPSAACDARQDRLSGTIPRNTKRTPTAPRSAFDPSRAGRAIPAPPCWNLPGASASGAFSAQAARPHPGHPASAHQRAGSSVQRGRS